MTTTNPEAILTEWRTARAAFEHALVSALLEPLTEGEVSGSVDDILVDAASLSGCETDKLDAAIELLDTALERALSSVRNAYPSEIKAVADVSAELYKLSDEAPISTVRTVLAKGEALVRLLTAAYPTRLDVDDWQAEHGDYFGDPNGDWEHIEELPAGWHWTGCVYCDGRFPTPIVPPSDEGECNDPMWCSANCQELHLGND